MVGILRLYKCQPFLSLTLKNKIKKEDVLVIQNEYQSGANGHLSGQRQKGGQQSNTK